jgi:hypothetical protein
MMKSRKKFYTQKYFIEANIQQLFDYINPFSGQNIRYKRKIGSKYEFYTREELLGQVLEVVAPKETIQDLSSLLEKL